MDTLHTVLRAIRGETKSAGKSRADHITVFREFLDQLERLNAKGAPRRGGVKATPAKSPRTRKR